jgi:hypothetical protein
MDETGTSAAAIEGPIATRKNKNNTNIFLRFIEVFLQEVDLTYIFQLYIAHSFLFEKM